MIFYFSRTIQIDPKKRDGSNLLIIESTKNANFLNVFSLFDKNFFLEFISRCNLFEITVKNKFQELQKDFLNPHFKANFLIRFDSISQISVK